MARTAFPDVPISDTTTVIALFFESEGDPDELNERELQRLADSLNEFDVDLNGVQVLTDHSMLNEADFVITVAYAGPVPTEAVEFVTRSIKGHPPSNLTFTTRNTELLSSWVGGSGLLR